jgi:hypothetical protein
MDINKFKKIEGKYLELKAKLDSGEVHAEEMKKELKKLMVLDDKGNYWMIGGKTGKWYMYDGTSWKEESPYQEDPSATTQFSLEESEPGGSPEPEKIEEREEPPRKAEAEERDLVPCKFCKSRIPAHSPYCSFCGGNQKEVAPPVKRPEGESELLLKSINLISLVFFMGGLGLILGVILGASFGIFNIMGDLIYQFPRMLQETRGEIQGGIIFAVIGGFCGFVFFSLLAVISTVLYNILSYIFGGIRFKIKL